MEFKILYGKESNEDLTPDYKSAIKFGSFRIGKIAIYFPALFAGTKYIPLDAINGAWVRKSTLSIKGCCAGQIPVFVLHISCENDQSHNITIDREKDAKQALKLIKEYRPNIASTPEELVATK